ncbi:MAG: ExeA family protein [Candidatus Krumholzibacteriia bacterium]
MNKNLKALYGLKYNPFSPELPLEALQVTSKTEDFLWRIENGLAMEGGFAMITGAPGTGKSVVMRLLHERLERLREVVVGSLEHPQSNLADFYREMGDLFGVILRPHNRWAGFRSLREKWISHIETTLMRPVLLVDEAQQMNPAVLSELRILASTRFDSRSILGVVLAGDSRLSEKLRNEELLPLGSRIRTRLLLEHASVEDLRGCLLHQIKAAGNLKLMTTELVDTLCEHAIGNHRMLATMANELLEVAAQREIDQLDEKLYLDVFATPATAEKNPTRRTGPAR